MTNSSKRLVALVGGFRTWRDEKSICGWEDGQELLGGSSVCNSGSAGFVEILPYKSINNLNTGLKKTIIR